MFPTAQAIDPLARAILGSLLNGFWQGAAITAAVALLLGALPRTSAATRHVVWLAALASVAVLPVVGAWPSAARVAADSVSAAAPAEPGPPASSPSAPWLRLPAPPEPWPLVVVALLCAVAAVRVAGVARGVAALRGLKRRSTPLPPEHRARTLAHSADSGGRVVRIRASDEVASPVTVGFRNPAILLPTRLLDGLAELQAAQLLVHETAHVRRRDDWTNLVQRLLEAVLFFYPFVRWIGTRLELERELACDEEVVARLPGRRSYALCLTRLALHAVAARTPLAPGAAPPGSQLERRVRALVAGDGAADARVSTTYLAFAAPAVLGATVAVLSMPAITLLASAAPLAALLPAARASYTVAAPSGPDAAPDAPRVASPLPAPRNAAAAAGVEAAVLAEPTIALACGTGACRAEAPLPFAGKIDVPPRTPAPTVASGDAPAPSRAATRPALEVVVALGLSPGVATPMALSRPGIARGVFDTSTEFKRIRSFRLRLAGPGAIWRPRTVGPAW